MLDYCKKYLQILKLKNLILNKKYFIMCTITSPNFFLQKEFKQYNLKVFQKAQLLYIKKKFPFLNNISLSGPFFLIFFNNSDELYFFLNNVIKNFFFCINPIFYYNNYVCYISPLHLKLQVNVFYYFYFIYFYLNFFFYKVIQYTFFNNVFIFNFFLKKWK